jgi:hypothetical protein
MYRITSMLHGCARVSKADGSQKASTSMFTGSIGAFLGAHILQYLILHNYYSNL